MVSVSDCVVLKYKHLTIATTNIQKYLGIERFNSPEGMTNTFNVIIVVIIIIIFFHLLPFLMVATLSLCNNVIIFCPVLLILSAVMQKKSFTSPEDQNLIYVSGQTTMLVK